MIARLLVRQPLSSLNIWWGLLRMERLIDVLTSILSSLSHLDPFRATKNGGFGFTWITEILNSGYPERERHRMIAIVVRLLGKEVDSHPPRFFLPDWVPPLLNLSLSEMLTVVQHFYPSSHRYCCKTTLYSLS